LKTEQDLKDEVEISLGEQARQWAENPIFAMVFTKVQARYYEEFCSTPVWGLFRRKKFQTLRHKHDVVNDVKEEVIQLIESGLLAQATQERRN
jgi:hypothetical protein